MKIWRFYKKPNDPDDVRKRYDLYALTNNPDYAMQFMDIRDMNLFYTRCTKEDRETYSKIANDNRNCVLGEYDIMTRSVNGSGLITHTKIKLIMTDYEYQCINGEEFQCEITADGSWWSGVPSYTDYKKKIKNALRILEYISNYKFYALPFEPKLKLDECDDDFSSPDIWIDEFGAFISIFGSTFK